MKKTLTFTAALLCAICSMAQVNFNVGPYNVDYYENGDVVYRVRDSIDLYEYFEFNKDTIIIVENKETLLDKAIQVSGFVETSHINAPKGIGIEGVWKQGVGKNFYLNAGLNINFVHAPLPNVGHKLTRNMLEVGIPLQLELGKLSRQSASLFGCIGVQPSFYTTMKAQKLRLNETSGYNEVCDGDKKSGFLFVPIVEFGANIPVGRTIVRVGVTGKYKVNCGSKDNGYDIYHYESGRAFLGAKVGVVF